MEINVGSRLKRAWNAFLNRDPPIRSSSYYYGGYSYRPYYQRLGGATDRTVVSAIYNRIAVDASSITIQHVRLDENGRFNETIDSGLNSCLNLSANIDQTGRSFVEDIVLTMLDEGVVAVVPVDTDADPKFTDSYEICTMRVGKITEWFPDSVRVKLYNDRNGEKEEIMVLKKNAAIIENPFYSVMNEPNGTMRRLIQKLNLLDSVDEQSSSGKLDLIIQLPYVIKNEARRTQAEERRRQIEDQLSGSKYGIAYTDGTERITQLNRSLDNNLLKQVEYLTNMAYSQLGLTQEIMNGTADDIAMANYYSRTIEPIVSAIVDEFKRKFLTKTAISQKQSIVFFRDPFKLVPIDKVAEMADKFTRNEIMSSNEIRQVIGLKPSKDPSADELRNKNLNQSENQTVTMVPGKEANKPKETEANEGGIENQNGND